MLREGNKDVADTPVLELEKTHNRTDSYYTPYPELLVNGIGETIAKELNIDQENFNDGVQFRSKATEPRVTIRNYASDTPMDSRRVCATCKAGGQPINLHNGFSRIWCREAFVRGVYGWKEEPNELKDNLCRDWNPKNPDCVG